MDQPIEWEDANDYGTVGGGKVETARFHEFTLNIRYDDSGAANPREWDNLSEIIIEDAPRRGNLGDRPMEYDEKTVFERGGFRNLSRYLRMKGALLVVPLEVFDDWRPTLKVARDPSSADGWAVVWPKAVETLGAPLDSIEEQTKAEIKEYNSYLQGEVYGYEVLDTNGETLDSVWGYIGDIQYVKTEAEGMARYHYGQKYPIPEVRERIGV